jgi:hypothetical protein
MPHCKAHDQAPYIFFSPAWGVTLLVWGPCVRRPIKKASLDWGGALVYTEHR